MTKKRILIVDDSFVMRALLRGIVTSDPDLEVAGEATNGLEALQQVKEIAPDLVLLDIEMPHMDGIECIKRLRLMSKVPVIIVSSVAQAGSPQAIEARKFGAAEVIAKPSGAMSLDLNAKKGHEIVTASRRVLGLS
ncbi:MULTISPECIES: response regulator [unclassified Limnohabitans]|jgi:two-component system chemotaxis response regulator CheB|uniref:response regulator n=1 Tax=unclassified Limnohabitans TaxID=2626134 RepID=UPI000376687F|nr:MULTISPECIES: response regulator [unclassified Limnohabitans]PIT74798.1 response regulator [Limnohabitans sp. G3-2]PIT82062.1 response regulator [Limnohabitans sp. 15K]